MNHGNQHNAFTGYLSKKVREKAMEHIDANCASLLDVACGNGLLFSEMKIGSHPKLFGLDVSRPLLVSAREQLNGNGVSFVEADATAMPYKSAQFDHVLCLNTTINLKSEHHLQSLIAELTRMCRPGGKLMFDIRNGSNLFLKMKYKIFSRLEHFPIQGFTVSQIKKILQAANFEITAQIPIGAPISVFAWGFVFIARPKHK